MDGLTPGMRSATGVLCSVCFMVAIVRVLLLLINNVPLFSSVYATFNATNAKKFNVGGSDVTDCDACLRIIVAMFVVLFNIGFGTCFFVVAGGFTRTFGVRRIQCCFKVVNVTVLVVAYGVCRVFKDTTGTFRRTTFRINSVVAAAKCTAASFGA